jgi:hypothetical protein
MALAKLVAIFRLTGCAAAYKISETVAIGISGVG